MSSLIPVWEPLDGFLALPSWSEVAKQNVAHSFVLLKTGKYSDLKIRCGTAEWRVHRSVLCPRSKYIAAACDGEFEVRVSLFTLQTIFS